MTFTQLQAEVRTRIDEASANFWSDADIKEALNDGYQEISDASEWYERNATVNLTASTTYYDLSSSSILTDEFLVLKNVRNSQTNRWLVGTDHRDLDRNRLGWENSTGTPEYFWVRGLWNLGIWPKPSATSGTVRPYYAAIPAALSAGNDVPGFPQEFHFGLVEYALYDLLVQDAETVKALRHWKQYAEYETNLTEYVQRRMSTDRVPMMKG